MKRIFSSFLICFLFGLFASPGAGQGLPASAFTNITLHKADGAVVRDASIVWRDGVIEATGKNINIPFDAQVWDGGDSLHVYPGFIDGNAYWGSPEANNFDDTPQRRGDPSYERAGINPQKHAYQMVDMSSDDFKKALKAGFTTAALATKGNMVPGQLDLFTLQPTLTVGDMYAEGIGMQMQLERSRRVYPSTIMGVMAKLQQLMLNAEALRQGQEYYDEKPTSIAPPQNYPVLQAFYPVMDGDQRVFFKADSKEMIERIFQLQDELGFDWVLVSGMEAFTVADELNERNIPVLASINFPEKPEWKKEDYEEKENLTDEIKDFREKRWQAFQRYYGNIKSLREAGVAVGFATADLELKDMADRLAAWNQYGGLNTADMLEVMTAATAGVLGFDETLGNLNDGQIASFSVMNKPFTEEKAAAVYTVSEGELTELSD